MQRAGSCRKQTSLEPVPGARVHFTKDRAASGRKSTGATILPGRVHRPGPEQAVFPRVAPRTAPLAPAAPAVYVQRPRRLRATAVLESRRALGSRVAQQELRRTESCRGWKGRAWVPSPIPRGVPILAQISGTRARCPRLFPNPEKCGLDLKFAKFLLLSKCSPPLGRCLPPSPAQKAPGGTSRSVPTFPASPGTSAPQAQGGVPSRPPRSPRRRAADRGVSALQPGICGCVAARVPRRTSARRGSSGSAHAPGPPARDREVRPAWGRRGQRVPARPAGARSSGATSVRLAHCRRSRERVNFLLPPPTCAPARLRRDGRPPAPCATARRHLGRRPATRAPRACSRGVWSQLSGSSQPTRGGRRAAMHIYVGLATSGCGRGGPGSPRSGPRGELA